MGKIRNLICAFKSKNSIFVRIFTGLTLLSLIMVSFMGFWMNNISSQNYRHQMALSNLNRLKQADEVMGLTVNMLSQNMDQAMWSNDFITYMVSPGRTAPDQDYRIIRQLKSIVSGSALVQNAFLYSPLMGEIYDSTNIFPAEDFEEWPVLEKYFQKEVFAERLLLTDKSQKKEGGINERSDGRKWSAFGYPLRLA